MTDATSRTTGGSGSRAGRSGGEAPPGSGSESSAGSNRRSPSAAEVFRAQLRLLFRRRWSLAGLALLTAAPMAILTAGVHGVETLSLSDGVVRTWMLPTLLALFWPAIATWRDDKPSERAYHWTLPVHRTEHQLLRTAAGWVHLMAGLAAGGLLAWAAMGAIQGGAEAGDLRTLAAVPPSVTVLYLVGSIPALTTERPVLWLIIGYAAVGAAMGIAALLEWSWLQQLLLDTVTSGRLSLSAAANAPATLGGQLLGGGSGVTASPWQAMGLWLAVTAGLTVATARIHLERAGEG